MEVKLFANLKKLFLSVTLFSIVSFSGSLSAGSFIVSNSNDAGEGSLREALNSASKMSEANAIYINAPGVIKISSTLTYASESPLLIFGKNQTIHANGNFTILEVTNGADLSVDHLKFRGPEKFSIFNRGDVNGPAGKGIFLKVRGDQTGTVNLVMHGVRVSDVAGHGVHIMDCTLADTSGKMKCGEGYGGAGEGSPASISVSVDASNIINVGMGGYDSDGLRVDERGAGSINASISGSQFIGSGADGVELDEGQEGSVMLYTNNSKYNNNGKYCDPDVMKPFVPSEDEGEFEDNQKKASDIAPNMAMNITKKGKYNGAINTGSPDDGCLETEVKFHDSGFVEEFEIAIDTDDGVDIDEAGPGDIYGQIVNSEVNGNFDEGFDIDEAGSGGIFMTINNTVANNNSDDGFKHSEEDEGSVTGQVESSTAKDNGGKGFVFEEEGEGNVLIIASKAFTSNNDDSDNTGMELVQEDEGVGTAHVFNSTVIDGFDLEGVNQIN